MAKFYTHYSRPDEDFEVLSDELIVERAGYIDTKTQIENFIRSGQLLMASRRSMYDDVGKDDDDAPMPPDRYINDPVDIEEQRKVNESYRQYRRAEGLSFSETADTKADSGANKAQVSSKSGTAPDKSDTGEVSETKKE